MKAFLSHLAIPVVLIVVLITGCGKDISVDPTADDGNFNETYIVVLDLNQGNNIQGAGSTKNQITSFIASNNIALDKVSFIYTKALTGFAAELTSDQLAKLNSNKLVKYIEKDKLISLPPISIEAKPTKPGTDPTQPAQSTPWGIGAVGGALTGTTFARTAWIIDTGIDLDHPDLNVVTTKCTTFVTTNPDRRNADDGNGHGTHVAGTVGAKNNTIGVVGVAPGCNLVAVKVLNYNGSGYISWIVAGIDYVAVEAESGDVANMSLGGSGNTSLDEAVENLADAGIHVVVAAGNSSADASYYSPARVNHANVYTISAHNSSYYWASWSNYGDPVDWCAPGVSIYSTYKGGTYATLSGTSMATPHVTGIIVAEGGVSQSSYNEGYVTGDPDNPDDPLASR